METAKDIKEKVKKDLVKSNTKRKAPDKVVRARNVLMKAGKLTNSVRELAKQNLCGACRLPKQYCRCGRPPAMNETALEKFEMAFKTGMNVTEACAEVGVSRKTYYEFEKSHLEWKELRSEWQSSPTRVARKTVEKEMQKDVKVAQWYLERKNREEFGRESEGNNNPAEIKINIIGKYEEPEQIEAMDITGIDVEFEEYDKKEETDIQKESEEKYIEDQTKKDYDERGIPIEE